MPDQNDDYTPDFQTPNQIAANRAYAKALMQAGLPGQGISGSSGNVTAVSPLSPFVQMASALYGRQQMNEAGAQEQRRQNEPVASYLHEQIPGEPQAASYATSPQASSFANENGEVKGSWFGNYNGQNNWVDKSDSGLQASGAPTSVPGIALPNRGTLGQLFDVTTPDGRTFTVRQTDLGPAKWTGRGVDINSAAAESMGYSPSNFPTDGKFTVRPHQGGTQTAGTMGTGGPALQFAGPGASGGDTANDAQAAMTMALQRGGRGGQPGVPGVPGQVPAVAGSGGPYVPGSFFMQRQPISRRTMGQMMTGDVNPALQGYVGQSYINQYQPIEREVLGGKVIRDAQGREMYIPGVHWTEEKTGDISTQNPQIISPTGRLGTLGGSGTPAAQPPAGAGSNVPPPPPSGGFNIGGGKGDIRAPTPATSGPRSEAAPTGANPAQVASRETGTVTDAAPPGVLGTTPPSAGPALAYAPPTTTAATPTTAPAGVRTAQAGKSLNEMTIEERANYTQERGLAAKQAEKDIDEYTKEYQMKQDAGQSAMTAAPQIQLASKLFKDPNLIQGPWSGVKQGINDTIAGLTGDRQALAASSLKAATDKIVATNILSQMQQTLKGLGQVRVAEINLLGQASASTYNTPQANAAILFMAQRSTERLSDIGRLTSAYKNGARWDENGNLITLHGTDRATLAGQNEAINTYMRTHPFLTEQEQVDLQKTLDDGEPKGRKKAVSQTPGLPRGLTVQ